VVGVYRVDSATLSRHIAVPESQTQLQVSPDAKIVILANHNLEFVSIPEFALANTPQICTITGRGVWQLGENDDYQVLNFQIQRENYRSDACGPKYSGQLNLYGGKPPYKLHITIGDPDSGDAVQLEKSGSS
jgi:hypothetical protein